MAAQIDALPVTVDAESFDDEEVDARASSLAREVWAKYGDDFERRLADLEAGKHPYQLPR